MPPPKIEFPGSTGHKLVARLDMPDGPVQRLPYSRIASLTFCMPTSISGDLDATQRAKLLEIADKFPVHRTLHAEVGIVTRIV